MYEQGLYNQSYRVNVLFKLERLKNMLCVHVRGVFSVHKEYSMAYLQFF